MIHLIHPIEISNWVYSCSVNFGFDEYHDIFLSHWITIVLSHYFGPNSSAVYIKKIWFVVRFRFLCGWETSADKYDNIACALQIPISILHQRFSMGLIKPSEVVKMKFVSWRHSLIHSEKNLQHAQQEYWYHRMDM